MRWLGGSRRPKEFSKVWKNGSGLSYDEGMVSQAIQLKQPDRPTPEPEGDAPMAKFAVILPAAGQSARFKDKEKKPFAQLDGRAVWLRAAELFASRSDVGEC